MSLSSPVNRQCTCADASSQMGISSVDPKLANTMQSGVMRNQKSHGLSRVWPKPELRQDERRCVQVLSHPEVESPSESIVMPGSERHIAPIEGNAGVQPRQFSRSPFLELGAPPLGAAALVALDRAHSH